MKDPLIPERFDLMVYPHNWRKVTTALEKAGFRLQDITSLMEQAEDFDPRIRTFAVLSAQNHPDADV